jgi:hypothetical protein
MYYHINIKLKILYKLYYMNIFDNKILSQYLLNLNHFEHGIKVKKDSIIVHKYNFGMYSKYYSNEYIYNTLKYLKYNEDQCSDVINYINTVKNPYLMFGVENNNVEVYVQTTLNPTVKYIHIEDGCSWDLKNNIKFYYTTIPFNSAYSIMEKNIDNELFKRINIFLKDNCHVLTKHDDNIFNFYIIKRKYYQVSEVKNEIISVLKYINNDIDTIENYLKMYLSYNLCWFRISKNINNDYEITFYFRKSK